MQRRIEEYQEKERQHSGKKLGDIDHSKFLFVDEDKSGSHNISGHLFYEGLSNESEHNSVSIGLWGEDAFIPIRQKDETPTPKRMQNWKK